MGRPARDGCRSLVSRRTAGGISRAGRCQSRLRAPAIQPPPQHAPRAAGPSPDPIRTPALSGPGQVPVVMAAATAVPLRPGWPGCRRETSWFSLPFGLTREVARRRWAGTCQDEWHRPGISGQKWFPALHVAYARADTRSLRVGVTLFLPSAATPARHSAAALCAGLGWGWWAQAHPGWGCRPMAGRPGRG